MYNNNKKLYYQTYMASALLFKFAIAIIQMS